ncbi:hypothetical protein WJX77_000398 [Trebouxia sp. C0004]
MGSDQEYEFMGPILGPIGIMVALPLVCYGLVYACNAQGCLEIRNMSIPGFPAQSPLISREAFFAIFGWMAFQTILHLALPGQLVKGVTLPNKEKLTYKLNAQTNLGVTLLAATTFSFYTKQLPLSWIYDQFLPLLTAACVLTVLLTVYLYLSSFAQSKVLSSGGNTESNIYNFFIGRELNPRIDALWFEKAILSTMDIVHDGFGFMLAFGDLVWVPFTYSLQARYLVDHPQAISNVGLLCILGLKAVGYCAFRGANSQKDTFRNDTNHPSVKHLQTLNTERGTQLITSGWWGIARHINYTGDWLMAWSWCLPCGFGSIVPYFYVIYFAVLLVHRQQRDEHACKRKYGADWDKYQAIVKYRLIPFVY